MEAPQKFVETLAEKVAALEKGHEAIKQQVQHSSHLIIENNRTLVEQNQVMARQTQTLNSINTMVSGLKALNILAGWASRIAVIGASFLALWNTMHGKGPPPP